MAQLWGGRFEKETDAEVFAFNASFSFDQRLLPQDIAGSKAHVTMLVRQKILSEEEGRLLLSGLDDILQDAKEGKLSFSDAYEDVHSFVEANLIDRLGEIGKKVHTGRSRNDQVATDMKLYVRDEIDLLHRELLALLQNLEVHLIEPHTQTFMPGFTHLQKAQPVTVAHHFLAYFSMLQRDVSRLEDLRKRMNTCPLGSGALAGTTYPLDRVYTASLLDFDSPTANSMDAVSDRDYLIELLSVLSILQMHLSRSCEEICTWNSDEYQFIELDDAYSTGSSIMPQKKNPDIAELIRGKTGRIYGSLMQLLTVLKALPLAYNKDLQEDKESVFDALDTMHQCLRLYSGMLLSLRFHTDNLEHAALRGFSNATDAADYLVRKGMPFRDAHTCIGKAVLYCQEKKCSLEELSLEEWQSFSSLFEADIREALSLAVCVNRRNTEGAPGLDAVQQQIKENRTYLQEKGLC